MLKTTKYLKRSDLDGNDYILIKSTGERIYLKYNKKEFNRIYKLMKRSLNQKAFNSAMEDLGLVRVRGTMSNKIYWE